MCPPRSWLRVVGIAPRGRKVACNTCLYDSRRAVPVVVAASNEGGSPCKLKRLCSKRSRSKANESGGVGPIRRGSCGIEGEL